MLPRTNGIHTSRNTDRKLVGPPGSHDHQLPTSLGGRIGIARLDRVSLTKRGVMRLAIHLIGAHMNRLGYTSIAGRIEQAMRPDHVGTQKRLRIL